MLSIKLHNIPNELKKLNQWVAWKEIPINSNKPSKIPLNPKTGRFAKVNDPKTWGSFEEAVNYMYGHNVGLGFVFTKNDPYIGIDIDNCVSHFIGKRAIFYSEEISSLVNTLSSYTEISPSGKGIHIIVLGSNTNVFKDKGVEVYFSGRYFTFTGHIIEPINRIRSSYYVKFQPAFFRK